MGRLNKNVTGKKIYCKNIEDITRCALKYKRIYLIKCYFRIHICITQLHTLPGVADRFLNDVRIEIENIMQNPNENLEGQVNEEIIKNESKLKIKNINTNAFVYR